MELKKQELQEIADEIIRGITKQIAKIELYHSEEELADKGKYGFLTTKVNGAYELMIMLQAEWSLLSAIANQMHREPVVEEEVGEYITEYFNILCGRIISVFNQRMKLSSRFKVPEFSIVKCPVIPGGIFQKENYLTSQGERAQIVIVFQ